MNWLKRFRKRKPKPGQGGTNSSAQPGDQNVLPAATWQKPAGSSGTILRNPGAAPESVMVHSAHPSVPRFSVGDRIADTYQVKRVIQGGMATVYVAHHDGWNLDLAIKVPHEDILADPDNAHRIEVEAEAW